MEHPLRVLHVVVNMNRGGAETLLMNLYRNLDRSKIQFDFLTCKEGIFDEEIVELGGRVHRIPYITDVGHTRYMKALDKFFSSYQEYKIIHSHMDKMSGFVLRSAKKAGILIRIAHSHNTRSEGGLAAKAYKWYAGKSILTCATHLLACSNAAARWLFADRANTAEILKNGIECDKFVFAPEIRRQVKEELQLHQDTFVVGHVGRFAHQKNHSFLIDVFVQLLKYKPNSILLLAGDGPLRLELEKKIKNLSLQNSIKILGVRSDIERIMQVFDVFVFPSYHEGLPVTLIEAQGAGLPCIISDTITREVDLNTGLTNFQSINSFPGVWAREILKVNNRIKNAKGLVRKGGYDIKDSAIWIENFYHNIS